MGQSINEEERGLCFAAKYGYTWREPYVDGRFANEEEESGLL